MPLDLVEVKPPSRLKAVSPDHALAKDQCVRYNIAVDRDLLRNLATEHLAPLLSGASIDPGFAASTAREKRVACINPQTIRFKPLRADDYRLTLSRKQAFAFPRPPEQRVVEAFIDELEAMGNAIEGSYRQELLASFQRRVIARAVTENDTRRRTLLSAIDELQRLAARLYEGQPVVAGIGIDPTLTGDATLGMTYLCRSDFGLVLSNGFDTLLQFDNAGLFAGHATLSADAAISFSPYRLAPIATWAIDGRLALSLNRLGEILIFQNQQLTFARRSGAWHFLTHESAISQIRVPQARPVRQAVYESCLDASFARTGACLGIVTSPHLGAWRDKVAKEDRLELPTASHKARALAASVSGRPFQDLDRRVRQELLAIDGATVLDYKGRVLAVGAIVEINAGSSGGGRLAAARSLGQLGLGIKISQDGGILGFGFEDEPTFRVMC